MSSVLSSASAIPTGCSAQTYSEFPTKDIACGVRLASNRDLMKQCCNNAPVESWAGDCGLYCLSMGQSVADLTKCFQEAGINPSDIMCNGNNTATATATTAPDSTSNPRESSSATNSAGHPQGTNGASAVSAPQGVSKTGLLVTGLLLVSAAFGTLL